MVNQTFKTKKNQKPTKIYYIPTLLPSTHQRHLVTAIPNYELCKRPPNKIAAIKKNYQFQRVSIKISKKKRSEPMKKIKAF